MEFLILMVCILIIILVLNNGARNRRVLHALIDHVSELNAEIKKLKAQLNDSKDDPGRWASNKETPPPTTIKDDIRPIVPKAEPSKPAPPKPTVTPKMETPNVLSEVPAAIRPQRPTQPAATSTPRESWLEKFLRNNPDLEKFIGENLINKVGIAVLVLGIAFFVKYAIDKEWINELGRVCIGLGCGALLVGIAHYLRNSYKAFSSVLTGGGLAVFYFTIAFAFHQYALLSQTAAFIIMVVITAFAVALSLLYDKLELAVIATVGGFITPFLVSTGQGNYIVLFSYLSILNGGLLWLSYHKRWILINTIALFFTVLITAGWMITSAETTVDQHMFRNAFFFVTIFYVQFLTMNLINQVRYSQSFKPFDFSLLLLINALFFTAGIILLRWYADDTYLGLFTVAVGCVNLALAYGYFRRPEADKRLLYLLIGLTLTFLSLAIPVQLQGHTITLFWSAEFVLLYWLWQRSGIPMFRIASFVVMGATLISLLMDWSIALEEGRKMERVYLPLIYHNMTGFVTNLVCVAAFAAFYVLVKKEAQRDQLVFGIPLRQVGQAMLVVSCLLLYITAVFGVNLLCKSVEHYGVPNVYHRTITALFVLAGMLALRKSEDSRRLWLQLVLVAVTVLYYWTSAGHILSLRNLVLRQSVSGVHLAMHWVSLACLLLLIGNSIRLVRRHQQVFAASSRILSWCISLALVISFSLECLHVAVVLGYRGTNMSALTRAYSRAGLTILWGLCSFVMMWLGMRHKFKPLRIISLTLFGLCLLKLFLFDIRNVSEGGKIAAFILLGILLLVVSFMYQKLKKMIIDDKT